MVWSPGGEPCAGCDLYVEQKVASGEPHGVGLHTGPDGRAISEDLPRGRYEVYLEEVSSLGSMVQVRSGHNVKTALVRSGEVTEVVFGEPRTTVEIRFRPPPMPGWRLRCSGIEANDLYDLRAEGSFEVRRRPGEALTLRLVNDDVSVPLADLAT
jgi:hypothetical protein